MLFVFVCRFAVVDAAIRNPAEQQLKNAEQSNFAGYLSALCSELSNESRDVIIRQQAGLLLKNTLTARSEQQNYILQQRWLQLPENVRQQIRAALLTILSSPHKNVRSTASLVTTSTHSIT